MGKASGTKRRNRKQFRYNVNRKRLNKKSTKMPRIKNALVKMAYSEKQGVAKNFRLMGLSNDPNRTIRIPSAQELLAKNYEPNKSKKGSKLFDQSTSKPKKSTTRTVADELEEQANQPVDSTFHVSNEIAIFAKYMDDKYGDDYKAMARDIRNYYQMTPKQIKRRIADYQSSQLISALKIANKDA